MGFEVKNIIIKLESLEPVSVSQLDNLALKDLDTLFNELIIDYNKYSKFSLKDPHLDKIVKFLEGFSKRGFIEDLYDNDAISITSAVRSNYARAPEAIQEALMKIMLSIIENRPSQDLSTISVLVDLQNTEELFKHTTGNDILINALISLGKEGKYRDYIAFEFVNNIVSPLVSERTKEKLIDSLAQMKDANNLIACYRTDDIVTKTYIITRLISIAKGFTPDYSSDNAFNFLCSLASDNKTPPTIQGAILNDLFDMVYIDANKNIEINNDAGTNIDEKISKKDETVSQNDSSKSAGSAGLAASSGNRRRSSGTKNNIPIVNVDIQKFRVQFELSTRRNFRRDALERCMNKVINDFPRIDGNVLLNSYYSNDPNNAIIFMSRFYHDPSLQMIVAKYYDQYISENKELTKTRLNEAVWNLYSVLTSGNCPSKYQKEIVDLIIKEHQPKLVFALLKKKGIDKKIFQIAVLRLLDEEPVLARKYLMKKGFFQKETLYNKLVSNNMFGESFKQDLMAKLNPSKEAIEIKSKRVHV